MENLKILMNECNLNKSQLAKETNIPQTTISGWFTTGRKPSYDMLIILADFFKCSIDFLVGRENDFGVIEYAIEPLNLSSDEKELINFYKQLNDRLKAKVVGYTFGLLEQQRA